MCDVDKANDHSTKSTWTQLVRYTYGVSKPENLVSDLISNGIILETSLLPIAMAFEGWLNEVLYNETMSISEESSVCLQTESIVHKMTMGRINRKAKP